MEKTKTKQKNKKEIEFKKKLDTIVGSMGFILGEKSKLEQGKTLDKKRSDK